MHFLNVYFCHAQQPDSLKDKSVYKTSLYYFYEHEYFRNNPKRLTPDTSVAYVHHIVPALDNQHNYLGTAGSASEPKAFIIRTNLTTLTSIPSYDLNLLSPDSIAFFKTNKRYTELKYHTGGFKEQAISFFHSQNITKLWNAGLIFDRQGVKDFMNFSDTFRSRFAFFTWYKSTSEKYVLFASAIWNTLKNGVNGGLENDSLFDNTPITNLGIKGLAYRISDAEQRIRKRVFSVSQYYYLGNKDSSAVTKENRFRLNLSTTLERKSFAYKDDTPDSSFYSDFFYGAATYDSLRSDDLRNNFSVFMPVKILPAKRLSYLRLTAGHQHVSYKQRSDSSWNNVSIGAGLNIQNDSTFSLLTADFNYVLSGFDEENFNGKVNLSSPAFDFGRFGLQLMSSRQSPDLIYRLYEGNNFRWNHSHDWSVKYFTVDFNYSLEEYSLHFNAGRKIISNYAYFGTDAQPHQFPGTIHVSHLELVKNFIYRNFHLDNSILYQQTDKGGIIRIPELINDHAFYLEKNYFRNAMRAAFGVALSFSSSYYANAFMPATGVFYIQQSTKTGGYPRFDVFVNVKVKNARLFVKLENAGDNLYDRSYYLTPHYPMPGRVFKFGLSWRFFDQ